MAQQSLFNLTRLGWGVVIPVLFLCAVGLLTIHATERVEPPAAGLTNNEQGAGGASAGLRMVYDAIGPATIRQSFYMVTGIGLMFLAMWPGYQRIGRYAYPLYWLAIFLLALLVIDRFIDLPFIPMKRFTRRWIQFGGDSSIVRIQPSEFMKVAIILVLARYLRFRKNYREWRGLAAPFLWTLLPMVLIHFQPDLGTLLMLLPVLFAMLFVAGARLRHLLTVVVLGLATLPTFYFYGMAEYQKKRVDVLFKQNSDDENWHRDDGYQLRQSKIALATGRVTGQGFRQGVFIESEKRLLPEEHNDFIFAMIGHQWGLVGCVLVLASYGVLVLFGIEIATVTNDPFGRLLAVGVIVMIVAQALLNTGMTIGLAPITGMTLPFVSAGGSSLWANFLAIGLLVNVAQRRPLLIANPPFEHGAH